jgi:hypothetical protein
VGSDAAAGAAGGTTAASVGTTKFAGGAGADQGAGSGGKGGGGAGTTAAGTDGVGRTSGGQGGAGNPAGDGGAGGVSGASGVAGQANGGGGGGAGATTPTSGGNGARGEVILTWNDPVPLIGPTLKILTFGVLSFSQMGEPWWLAGNILSSSVIAAYQAIRADDLANSYINRANPGTLNAAPGAAPSFSSSVGWTFNGTSHYLTTGITPTTNHSVIVRFDTPTNIGFLFGAWKSAAPQSLFAISPDVTGVVRYYKGSTLRDVSPNLVSGTLGISGDRGYRNGTAEGSNLPADTAPTLLGMYIGALNRDNALNSPLAVSIQAIAFYNTALTATQVDMVSDAMMGL